MAFEAHGGLVVIGIVLLGLVLRLPELTGHWLNSDEGIYGAMLTAGDRAQFSKAVAQNAHPPLYFMILRGLGQFTIDFIWFRVVALVCGCVAIFAAYFVGREVVGRGMTGAVTGVFAPDFSLFQQVRSQCYN